MPSTEGFPFRRLWVDHMIVGTSRIWWELDRNFNDPLPYTFQLQAGNTGNYNAVDWVNVGSPAVNSYFAEDDERREGSYGKTLMTHYRVKLTTGNGRTYVSLPVHTFGVLGERDWVFAREIVRKEKLRHRLVSVEGYLVRRMRFGPKCTQCTDPLTGEILDSNCPICNGTGFEVGYHPPVPLAVDMNPEVVVELLKGTEPPGPSIMVDNTMRILGFPATQKFDVWVDGKSDQRWVLDEIGNMAEWRHVPLVTSAKVSLLPFTDPVYKIEVGGEPAELAGPYLPSAGTGDTCIDHDYGGLDNLAYVDTNGQGIVGATILLFNKTDYDNGARTAEEAIAASATGANGRWRYKLCVCCGREYVLVLEKPDVCGPDVCELTIPCPDSSSDSSSFWSDSSMGIQ
jgi:hypothetical protein